MIVTLGYMPRNGITGLLGVNSTSTAKTLSESSCHAVLHHNTFPSTAPRATFPGSDLCRCTEPRTQKGSLFGLMFCWHHLEIINMCF